MTFPFGHRQTLVIVWTHLCFFAEKSFFSAMSSDAKSPHLRLVTPPNNLTKARLLNLERYK
jgi:hypothetical protein